MLIAKERSYLDIKERYNIELKRTSITRETLFLDRRS